MNTSKLRILVQIFCFPLPWFLRRFILNRLLKYKLEDDSRIGFSIIDSKYVQLGKKSIIGSFNFFKGLESLILKEEAKIGNLNYIAAVSKQDTSYFVYSQHRYPSLTLEKGAAITSRHFFDCNDAIKIGQMTTIAGAGSQFWTHEIDVVENHQTTKPIKIGEFSYIGSRCLLLAGTVLPVGTVVAAGSTVRGVHESSYTLLAGQPALVKKQWSVDCAKYFRREQPYVN